MARSAGGDPAQGPEVLLRWRQLPAEDLHRTATWHGGALRAAQLPIERSSPLADACPGVAVPERDWHAGSDFWRADRLFCARCGIGCSRPSLQLRACSGSMTGHGERLIGTGPFCAIWKQARSSTYYLIGRQQPWPHGWKITPERRSSAVTGPVLMPRPPAEPPRYC
jgi:hypothetical protein